MHLSLTQRVQSQVVRDVERLDSQLVLTRYLLTEIVDTLSLPANRHALGESHAGRQLLGFADVWIRRYQEMEWE